MLIVFHPFLFSPTYYQPQISKFKYKNNPIYSGPYDRPQSWIGSPSVPPGDQVRNTTHFHKRMSRMSQYFKLYVKNENYLKLSNIYKYVLSSNNDKNPNTININ